jgi:putative ABC transport system ATP-binding protein
MELLAANAVRPDRAVIVVTHDARVFRYADSIAHMDDGRIVNVTRRDNGSRAGNDQPFAGALREIYA